jgi:hypothetical protein
MSVIWGSGTYSSNHHAWEDHDDFVEEPATVEVMVFGPGGATANEDGEPHGYVTADRFLELAEVFARQSSSPAT